ncbi:Antitoxin [Brevibacillus sp. IT-7CA2]|uniref:hypothetical protein n=1 Tax=Brevibacillus sp. IT-7CA2 TaxID=3026436 RepID=UPI0039DF4183
MQQMSVLAKEEFKILKNHFTDFDIINRFSSGKYISLIDRYPRKLTYEEAKNTSLSYSKDWPRSSNLKHEYLLNEQKYLLLLKMAYEHNDKECVYVFCKDFMHPEIRWIDYLDQEDKDLARNIISFIKDNRQEILKVSDFDILTILTKMNLREAIYCNFFFDKTKSVLIGYYEMIFLLYCNAENTLNEYKKMATTCNLFTRTPNT